MSQNTIQICIIIKLTARFFLFLAGFHRKHLPINFRPTFTKRGMALTIELQLMWWANKYFSNIPFEFQAVIYLLWFLWKVVLKIRKRRFLFILKNSWKSKTSVLCLNFLYINQVARQQLSSRHQNKCYCKYVRRFHLAFARARQASRNSSYFLKLKQKSNSRVLVKTRLVQHFARNPKCQDKHQLSFRIRERPFWKSNVICRKVLHNNGRPRAGKLFSFDKVDPSSKVCE